MADKKNTYISLKGFEAQVAQSIRAGRTSPSTILRKLGTASQKKKLRIMFVKKYNHWIANLLIFHNCYTITKALKELEDEGMQLTPELLTALSPYKTHPNPFGMYELRTRKLDSINYEIIFNI